jgi:catechol 2,3-dioxygenase-like lactoylglutathione lyase family enzyme
MIKVNEIAFTGYPVTDKARARAFYEGILNLKPAMESEHEGGFWIEYDIAGSTLAISNYWKGAEKCGPSLALEVDDYEATLEILKAKGVTFDGDPMDFPSCHFAVITDPDGNLLVIHKRKPAHG